jgi:hypothetical protein
LISHLSFPDAPIKPCNVPFALESWLRNHHPPRKQTYNENQARQCVLVSDLRGC